MGIVRHPSAQTEIRPFPAGSKRDSPPSYPPPAVRAGLAQIDDCALFALRAHTRTGRPCGAPSFLDELESLTQRALRPKKRGRKPKEMQTE